MKRERYPLEAARTVRENELDEAREGLARASRAAEDADDAVRSAERRVDDHRRETEEIGRRETERDGAGRSAAEMLAAQDYLKRRGSELTGLIGELRAARERAAEARRLVEGAREALAQSRAALESVERHRERWEAQRKLVGERRAEAEQDDLAASRHHRDD